MALFFMDVFPLRMLLWERSPALESPFFSFRSSGSTLCCTRNGHTATCSSTSSPSSGNDSRCVSQNDLVESRLCVLVRPLLCLFCAFSLPKNSTFQVGPIARLQQQVSHDLHTAPVSWVSGVLLSQMGITALSQRSRVPFVREWLDPLIPTFRILPDGRLRRLEKWKLTITYRA